MRILLFLFALIVCTLKDIPSADAVELPGKQCIKATCFTKEIRVRGETIGLLGTAVFRYLFFDVYTAALYAPSEWRRTKKFQLDTPGELVIEYHRSISAKDLAESALAQLGRQNAVLSAEVRADVEKLHEAYVDVNEGDRYSLRYEPGIGTSLSLNGRLLVLVRSAEFAERYFHIWLDAKTPLSREVRENLFGGS